MVSMLTWFKIQMVPKCLYHPLPPGHSAFGKPIIGFLCILTDIYIYIYIHVYPRSLLSFLFFLIPVEIYTLFCTLLFSPNLPWRFFMLVNKEFALKKVNA